MLSAVLKGAMNSKKVPGIKVCIRGPKINLLYVDDILIFFQADIENCQNLSSIFIEFGEFSRLRLNGKKP